MKHEVIAFTTVLKQEAWKAKRIKSANVVDILAWKKAPAPETISDHGGLLHIGFLPQRPS